MAIYTHLDMGQTQLRSAQRSLTMEHPVDNALRYLVTSIPLPSGAMHGNQ